MKRKRRPGKVEVTIISIVGLVLIWALVACLVDLPVILPSPVEVLRSFFVLMGQRSFLDDIGATLLRSLESFALITVCGALVGIAAGMNEKVLWAVSPLVTVFKATPVMSVILIAFIWFRTGAVPVFSAFLMGFPVMFVQTVQGVKSMDLKLDQMCRIYRFSPRQRLVHFVIPSLIPSLVTGSKQALSMVWKVVIAAEVIIIPKRGVGRGLQLSHIQLETPKVFAWTLVAIVLTAIGDVVFNRILKKTLSRRFSDET